MNVYVPGQTVVLTGTFLDPTARTGLAATALKLRVIDPTGQETDYSGPFGLPAAGQYTQALVPLISGVWRHRWEATQPFAAACEGVFMVSASHFGTPL